MKIFLIFGIVAILLATTTVLAGTTTKTYGWYCYPNGDKDYYEKAMSVVNKRTEETYSFYEDNTMYKYLGQEQFRNGVKIFDTYTKNDVTFG